MQWHSNIDIGRNSSATIEHKKGHCGNTEVLVVRCESTIHHEFLLSSYTFLCFSHGNLQMPRTHVVTGHAATIVTRSEVRVIAAKTESLCEVRCRENGFLTDPEVCCLFGSFYRSLWHPLANSYLLACERKHPICGSLSQEQVRQLLWQVED